VLDPKDFAEGLIGIENHLNFFHRKRAGLSVAMAKGLCRFLNSSVADRYFRQFNGHTQVNASDLRAFRKLVQENLYTAASVITSPATTQEPRRPVGPDVERRRGRRLHRLAPTQNGLDGPPPRPV
jgi:adenine-specific DNA-methyltransferase